MQSSTLQVVQRTSSQRKNKWGVYAHKAAVTHCRCVFISQWAQPACGTCLVIITYLCTRAQAFMHQQQHPMSHNGAPVAFSVKYSRVHEKYNAIWINYNSARHRRRHMYDTECKWPRVEIYSRLYALWWWQMMRCCLPLFHQHHLSSLSHKESAMQKRRLVIWLWNCIWMQQRENRKRLALLCNRSFHNNTFDFSGNFSLQKNYRVIKRLDTKRAADFCCAALIKMPRLFT